MSRMDEKRAMEILDLNPDATKDDVSKRYGILTRKFRTIERDEKGNTIDDITRAYNCLMGITFIDEKEEERQKALRENPPFLARVLKKDPVKLENFFHYYRTHMILTVVVMVFLVFSVRSCMNRIEPDFSVVLFGNVMIEETQALQDYIKERIPELLAPDVQNMPANSNDPEYQMAFQMKLVAMISANDIDILIMDKSHFETYAGQGIFLPLDELMDELGLPKERFMQAAEVLEQKENGELVFGPVQYYGLDVSDSSLVEENKIYGSHLVAGIVTNSQRMDKAVRFMKLLE